jgi:hypothetical protein
MQDFHVTIHVRPPDATAGNRFDVHGMSVTTLHIPQQFQGNPFSLSFEEVSAALQKLPRMFLEPDGSFVWVSPQGSSQAWQLDGVLYDRNDRLLFVELKGTCPPDELDQLLAALGWPSTALMFQLVREAVFLDEVEFRRFVER